MHPVLLGTLAAVLLGGEPPRNPPTASREIPTLAPGSPQLFLDDFLIARTQCLKRQLETPVRHPRNPLIVQDRPWEARMLSVYGTVLVDSRGDRFRCWYLASPSDAGIPDTPEAPGTAEYIQCYAESDDGVSWRKPNVTGRAYGPYRAHNIVLARAHGFCVLQTPEDPDAGRHYRGLGGNVLGFSPDGIHWSINTPAAASWAAAVGKNDTSSCVVRWQGQYLAYVRYQEPERTVQDSATGIAWQGVMRGVGLSSSSDFNHWTAKESVFKADLRDGYPWAQPYGLCVTPYGDVLIGLVPMLHLAPGPNNNARGTMDVQMVVSRDGRHWQRVADRASFLDDAQNASQAVRQRPWDAHIFPSTTMFVRDDTVYVYYTGTNLLHGEGRSTPGLKARYGIGLATLPADRFVALRPDPTGSEGLLQTRPFQTRSSRLLVNAQVDPADLEVELCDAAGNVLPGLGRHLSRLAARDRLRYEVQWESSVATRSLGDALKSQAAICLRFYLRRGALYGFEVH